MRSKVNLERLPDDCGRLLSEISQADLHSVMLRVQEEEFPEEFDPFLEMMEVNSALQIEYGGYIIFAPSWHASESCPLVTPEMILSLRGEARLLSVGAGPAHLERLLVSRFGVNPDAISIADLPSASLGALFTTYRFDMHQDWPQLDTLFDWVIFPESAFINNTFDGHTNFAQNRISQPFREQGLLTLANRALKVTKPTGTVKIELQGAIGPVAEAVAKRLQELGFGAKMINDRILAVEKTT